MILLKFIFWVLVITFTLGLLIRLLGPWMLRRMMRNLNRKAQQAMDDQTRAYQRHTEQTPFEESAYYGEDVRVSVRRGAQNKQEREKQRRNQEILESAETVDFEEID